MSTTNPFWQNVSWADWERDGYVVLRGAVPAVQLDEIRGWVDEIVRWAESGGPDLPLGAPRRAGGPGLHHFEQTDAGPALARSEDLIPHHAGVRALLTEGLVPDLAGQLLGEPAVLYKEKINYKHPGGGGFAPHQDAPAYRFVDHHVSCMLPLDPATEASGCLWVARAAERGLLPRDGNRGLRADVVAALEWHPVELEPGDLLWFDSYAPHYSETNTTGTPRRAFYLTYNAASAGDFRTTYYEDKHDEFERTGAGSERVRLSIADDFLGRPVDG